MESIFVPFVFVFVFFFLQLVFDTAKAPFTKTSAGLIVGGGVFLGIGIVCGAVRHQQIKHGERVPCISAAEKKPARNICRKLQAKSRGMYHIIGRRST